MSMPLDRSYYENQTLLLPPHHRFGKYCYLVSRLHSDDCNLVMEKENPHLKGRLRKIWWWFKPDWLFAFLLVGSIFILTVGGMKAEPVMLEAPAVLPKLALLIGAMVMLSGLAIWGAKLDRKHLDDYQFQMVTNGAVIGIIATLFLNMVWEVGRDILPPITSDDLMAVMLGCWSMGYFFYRWRGLNI